MIHLGADSTQSGDERLDGRRAAVLVFVAHNDWTAVAESAGDDFTFRMAATSAEYPYRTRPSANTNI
jgi:hypothetical protein